MTGSGMVMVLALIVFVLVIVSMTANVSEETIEGSERRGAEPEPGGEEWPVVAEDTNEQIIHTLKSLLESNDIPTIVETENPNAVQGAISALHNRLRVKPDRVPEARNVIEDNGQGKYLTDDSVE